MPPRSAARAVAARRSAIREVFDAANKIPDAIRLEIGEPSFRTPRFVVDAALEAARAGLTGYTPNGGYASLRESLAAKIERVDGYAVDPDQVVVTPGAMNALFSIYLALLEPGDEVLLPTPGFPNMDEMVRLLGGEPVFYRLDRDAGFLPSREQLEPLVTARTKAIFANTPGNPTGAVFPADTVRGLAELAAERGIWLISDEVYDELILDDEPHVSAASTRAGRADRLGLQLLEGLRDDGLAARLLRRAGRARRGAAQAAGARGLVPVGDLAARRRRRAGRAARRVRRDARRLPRAARPRRRGGRGARARRLPHARHLLHARRHRSRRAAGARVHAAAARRARTSRSRPGEVFGPGCEDLVRISFGVEEDVLVEGIARIARAIETFAA